MAGIELDAAGHPVFFNGHPKWIRPVCNTPHGRVPNYIAVPLSVLEVIEMDITGRRPQGYQSENVTFNEKSIRAVGKFSVGQLESLLNHPNLIFGNKGKAVSGEQIAGLDHSLLLLSATEFGVEQKVFEDRPDKKHTRLHFTHNGSCYDFPITDPIFLYKHQNNPNLLKNIKEIYLVVSVGIEWQGWHYKLVATVLSKDGAFA